MSSEETALVKHRLEPGESIQHSKVLHKPSYSSQRQKGLEQKYISYNRTLMFSTTNKRWDGSIWRLYHSVDSLCEYLFFTILKMIIIIKVSS